MEQIKEILSPIIAICGKAVTNVLERWWEFWKDPLFRNAQGHDNFTLYINIIIHLISTLSVTFGFNIVRPMFSTIICLIVLFISLAAITITKNLLVFTIYKMSDVYRSLKAYINGHYLVPANG